MNIAIWYQSLGIVLLILTVSFLFLIYIFWIQGEEGAKKGKENRRQIDLADVFQKMIVCLTFGYILLCKRKDRQQKNEQKEKKEIRKKGRI